jgi:hypothetical protein
MSDTPLYLCKVWSAVCARTFPVRMRDQCRVASRPRHLDITPEAAWPRGVPQQFHAHHALSNPAGWSSGNSREMPISNPILITGYTGCFIVDILSVRAIAWTVPPRATRSLPSRSLLIYTSLTSSHLL